MVDRRLAVESGRDGKDMRKDPAVFFHISRFIRGKTHLVQLSGRTEIVVKGADVVVDFRGGMEEAPAAVRLVDVGNADPIGIIGRDVLSGKCPYIAKPIDGDLAVDTVFRAQIDVTLHGGIVVVEHAGSVLCDRDDVVFVEIRAAPFLVDTALSLPRNIACHNGRRLLPEFSERADIVFEYGKMRVRPERYLMLAREIGGMLPQIEMEPVLFRRGHAIRQNLHMGGHLGEDGLIGAARGLVKGHGIVVCSGPCVLRQTDLRPERVGCAALDGKAVGCENRVRPGPVVIVDMLVDQLHGRRIGGVAGQRMDRRTHRRKGPVLRDSIAGPTDPSRR